MNRKILALILALVAVTAAVVLAVTLNKDTPDGNVSGVADSIFDTEPVETQKPAETTVPEGPVEATTPATEHGNTIPTGPADPDAGHQAPDVDVPKDVPPAQTEPTVTEPVVTEPAVTEPEETEPQQTQPNETEPVQEVPEGEIDYEAFMALEPAAQRAYMESFESVDAFFKWYNAAKEAYEQAHPSIDVGDGVIDLEDLFG